MLNGDGKENGKKSIGLISKKKSFFVHFFTVVLNDYKVKLPSYTFYGRNVVQSKLFVSEHLGNLKKWS